MATSNNLPTAVCSDFSISSYHSNLPRHIHLPALPTQPFPSQIHLVLTVFPTQDANVTNGLDHNHISGLKGLSGNTSGNMAPVVAGGSSELQPVAEPVLDPISRVVYTYPLACC